MAANAAWQWLIEIAFFVETYPMMPPECCEPPVPPIIETPTQATRYAAAKIEDATEREAVMVALPRSRTQNFAEAARLIREAAARAR